MIKKVTAYITKNTYPYRNLAVEEYLTMHVAPGEIILYVWQNANTVVIGRNQNAWKECRVSALEADNGYVVRRLSGGGAVYHDMGNLNFTFCVRKEDYDVNRQLQVIVEAMKLLGMEAKQTGRNDITIDGKKFSGNAFFEAQGCCYHHGTLLLNVDTTKMTQYLNVDMAKLQSKGVDSVKARVTNLVAYRPDITVEMVTEALLKAMEMVYGYPVHIWQEDQFNREEIQQLTEKFSDWNWLFGRKIPFNVTMQKRFSWGDIDMRLAVDEGHIQDIRLYSDMMEQNVALALEEALRGCRYVAKDLMERVQACCVEQNVPDYGEDIKTLVKEQL